MSSPSHSRLAQAGLERQGSIKFTDPFNPVPRAPAPILVRRGKTVDSMDLDPHSPVRPTVDVHDHQLVGRAAPATQFKMVTSPRSPIATNTVLYGNAVRAPPRSRSTTLVRPAPLDLSTSGGLSSPQCGTSMIPVRTNTCALAQSHQVLRSTSRQRGALPQAWVSNEAVTSSNWRDTMLTRSVRRVVDMEHRRTASDSAIVTKPQIAEYPHLSPTERSILLSKLKMLLKSIEVDKLELSEWERTSFTERVEARGLACRVFGTAVRESVSYASCKVVLGEHTHYLPTCVFASVEQICRSGIATPALFRLAPSRNKRTLEHLTRIYNAGPSYGQTHSLANEDISNVCALLKLYLRGLPEPIFSPALWPVLCQVASGQTEPGTRIAAIQAMFHLLDRSSFSTLVYILAFLHQLALHGDQNGLTITTLAGMFGPALFVPRTQAAAVSVGVVLSPEPEVPPLVKNFRTPEDKTNGARVLGWILDRWEQNRGGGIAAGLLSLDIAKDGEDVAEWGARFAVEQRRESFGSDSETMIGEGSTGDRKLSLDEPEKSTEFPFPEVVSVDQVRVKQVRHSIVEITEAPSPQFTRPSSPATVWSQETAPQKSPKTYPIHSPVRSLTEPHYVAELRQRMEAQETELVALRRELAAIRDRFVFPLPPTEIPSKTLIEGHSETGFDEASGVIHDGVTLGGEMDEDMMPTPRPPSRPHFGEPPTPTSTSAMRELVHSLQSEPTTPLFGRALRIQPALSQERGDEILGANVFSDLGRSTPPSDSESEGSSVSDRTFFVANPDPNEDAKEKRELSELYAARDALKGALAAMAPVQVQLKAVEQELQSRAG